jgi:hypothetical protein
MEDGWSWFKTCVVAGFGIGDARPSNYQVKDTDFCLEIT